MRRSGSAARVSDIGHAIQRHVEAGGFSVVREFVGHGIGAALHEDPQIANYGEPGHGPRLAEGMVLAIEPMVNMGKPAVRVLSDGWTAVTRDGSLSAHFEHTVAVTKSGPLVLTQRSVAPAAAPVSGVAVAQTSRRDGSGMRAGRATDAVSVEGTVMRGRCRTGCFGWRSTGSVRSRRTCRAGRAGTSSGCWSAIGCGWSSRRGI